MSLPHSIENTKRACCKGASAELTASHLPHWTACGMTTARIVDRVSTAAAYLVDLWPWTTCLPWRCGSGNAIYRQRVLVRRPHEDQLAALDFRAVAMRPPSFPDTRMVRACMSRWLASAAV